MIKSYCCLIVFFIFVSVDAMDHIPIWNSSDVLPERHIMAVQSSGQIVRVFFDGNGDYADFARCVLPGLENDGNVPLYISPIQKNCPSIEKANVQRTLFYAAQEGDFSLFQSALSAGADINESYDKDVRIFAFHKPKCFDQYCDLKDVLSGDIGQIFKINKPMFGKNMMGWKAVDIARYYKNMQILSLIHSSFSNVISHDDRDQIELLLKKFTEENTAILTSQSESFSKEGINFKKVLPFERSKRLFKDKKNIMCISSIDNPQYSCNVLLTHDHVKICQIPEKKNSYFDLDLLAHLFSLGIAYNREYGNTILHELPQIAQYSCLSDKLIVYVSKQLRYAMLFQGRGMGLIVSDNITTFAEKFASFSFDQVLASDYLVDAFRLFKSNDAFGFYCQKMLQIIAGRGVAAQLAFTALHAEYPEFACIRANNLE